MVNFKRTREGKWAVLGPAGEVFLGNVTVTKRGGRTRTVRVVALGEPFIPSWDPRPHRYGYLEARQEQPRRRPRRRRAPRRETPWHDQGAVVPQATVAIPLPPPMPTPKPNAAPLPLPPITQVPCSKEYREKRLAECERHQLRMLVDETVKACHPLAR